MGDIFLMEMYDNIKDPSWPPVTTYNDFISLPDHIIHECKTIHCIERRISEIHNKDYWRSLTTNIFVHDNLAYVPIPKCATSYYSDYFGNVLGWRETTVQNIDVENTYMFGLIMNPLTHFFKGITQCLWQAHIANCKKEDMEHIVSTYYTYIIGHMLVGDTHTLPYNVRFGDLLHKIHWIPMDQYSDIQIKKSLESFFTKTNHSIELDYTDLRMNESTEKKKKLLNIVESIVSSEEYRERLYRLYILRSSDLLFYNNLINTFNPNWSHIQFD